MASGCQHECDHCPSGSSQLLGVHWPYSYSIALLAVSTSAVTITLGFWIPRFRFLGACDGTPTAACGLLGTVAFGPPNPPTEGKD